jgi:Na+(H+)/acetate symporter ActP
MTFLIKNLNILIYEQLYIYSTGFGKKYNEITGCSYQILIVSFNVIKELRQIVKYRLSDVLVSRCTDSKIRRWNDKLMW